MLREKQSSATTTEEYYQNKLAGLRKQLRDHTDGDVLSVEYLEKQIGVVKGKLQSMFPMRTF